MGKEKVATHEEIESMQKEANSTFSSVFLWLFEMIHLDRLGRDRLDIIKEELIMSIKTSVKEASNIRTRESLSKK